jgi:hypothetical protein
LYDFQYHKSKAADFDINIMESDRKSQADVDTDIDINIKGKGSWNQTNLEESSRSGYIDKVDLIKQLRKSNNQSALVRSLY